MKELLIILVVVAVATLIKRKITASLDYAMRAKIELRSSSKLQATLAQVIKAVHGLPYEVEYIIDSDGEIIFNETQYSSEEVNFTDEQIAYMQAHPGLISVHNHDEDVPPSVRDLNFAACTGPRLVIVVSPNYVYTVMPADDGWKSEQQLERAVHKHLDLCEIIEHGNKIIGIERDGAVLVEQGIEIKTTDAAITAITHDLGYKYRRREYQP